MHFDNHDHPGANAITGSAQARGVPVVSAKQMLTWLDGRNGSSFSDITWTTDAVNYFSNFTVSVGAGANNLRGMLPVHSGNGELVSLTRDGSSVALTTEVIKGIEYAFFAATPGDYIGTYGIDNIAPVITDVVATPAADGTATITWTTDEASTSRVDYGTVSGTLNLNVSAGAMVTAHTVNLTGLAPTTTYYFRVTSADDAGNSTSMPVAPAEYSFTTPAGICAQDRTLADFSLGTPGENTQVVLDGDGAVILKPGYLEEFTGSSVPAGWVQGALASPWSPSGTFTYTGGQVTVDGSHLYSIHKLRARIITGVYSNITVQGIIRISDSQLMADLQHHGLLSEGEPWPTTICMQERTAEVQRQRSYWVRVFSIHLITSR